METDASLDGLVSESRVALKSFIHHVCATERHLLRKSVGPTTMWMAVQRRSWWSDCKYKVHKFGPEVER